MQYKTQDINRVMHHKIIVKQPMEVQQIMDKQRRMEVMLQLSMMIDPTVVMVSEFFFYL